MTFFKRLRDTSGFSLMELIMVVAVIAILSAVGSVSYTALQQRTRFSQIKGDIDAIAKAAFSDFSGSPTNEWAAMVMPGAAPSFSAGHLSSWPTPPCLGWMYSYDNFFGVPGVQAVRITVRRPDLSSIWSMCLQNYGGNCQGDDGFGGTPPEISTLASRYVTCGE
jgi:prepilin-type N-terminal cleavage/methylation domain-containing protein